MRSLLIDQHLIAQLADLSRLAFSAEEKKQIEEDLKRIIEFINKLNELETMSVPPLIYLNEEESSLREDEVNYHVTKEEALKNAPQKDSDYFKVPKVLQKN